MICLYEFFFFFWLLFRLLIYFTVIVYLLLLQLMIILDLKDLSIFHKPPCPPFFSSLVSCVFYFFFKFLTFVCRSHYRSWVLIYLWVLFSSSLNSLKSIKNEISPSTAWFPSLLSFAPFSCLHNSLRQHFILLCKFNSTSVGPVKCLVPRYVYSFFLCF